jgi:hypothetical protein
VEEWTVLQEQLSLETLSDVCAICKQLYFECRMAICAPSLDEIRTSRISAYHLLVRALALIEAVIIEVLQKAGNGGW